MAGKNRKRRSGGYVPGPFAIVVAVVSAAAIAYLWLNARCEAVGNQLKRLEAQRIEIHRRFANEQYLWMQIKSPENMENALRRHNIAMTWPENSQIVHLSESDSAGKAATEDQVATVHHGRVAEKIAMND